MKKINSKRKGAQGEREWAAFLRAAGINAIRGVQYQGSIDSPDVISDWDHFLHFEVKRTERFNAYNALEQAESDVAGSNITPVVAHRSNKKEWLIVLKAENFIDIIQKMLYNTK